MFKAFTEYQLLKSFGDNIFISKKEKNLILEPLCVILRLTLLQYKEKGTKLSIQNNSIRFQEPSYDQGLVRMIEGDCREDLHNLYHPILKCIEWYSYNEKMLAALGGDVINDKIAGFIYIGKKDKEPNERRRPIIDKVVSFI